MKSQTYLRLSLLIPYLFWIVSAGVTAITNQFPEYENIIGYIAIFYTIGIIIWGIPYTILAIALWFWSRGKDTRKVARIFALSPILLGILLVIEILIVSINWSDISNSFLQPSSDFTASILTLGGLSLLYGYLCIFIAAGLYKLLKAFKVIKAEVTSISPNALE